MLKMFHILLLQLGYCYNNYKLFIFNWYIIEGIDIRLETTNWKTKQERYFYRDYEWKSLYNVITIILNVHYAPLNRAPSRGTRGNRFHIAELGQLALPGLDCAWAIVCKPKQKSERLPTWQKKLNREYLLWQCFLHIYLINLKYRVFINCLVSLKLSYDGIIHVILVINDEPREIIASSTS